MTRLSLHSLAAWPSFLQFLHCIGGRSLWPVVPFSAGLSPLAMASVPPLATASVPPFQAAASPELPASQVFAAPESPASQSPVVSPVELVRIAPLDLGSERKEQCEVYHQNCPNSSWLVDMVTSTATFFAVSVLHLSWKTVGRSRQGS